MHLRNANCAEKWYRPALSLFIPIGFVLLILSLVPLRGALELGLNESFELMKGFLLSRGFALYDQIWSDQPPLHTALLAWLFKLFGPSPFAARLLSVSLSAFALWSFWAVICSRSGLFAAWVSIVLLVTAPHFLQQSVSATIVMPAISLALVSVWLALNATPSSGRWRLLCSGCLMGLALQVKYAVALFIPALVLDLLLNHRRSAVPSAGWQLASGTLTLWAIGVAVGFASLYALFPGATVDLLLYTHFSGETRTAFADDGSFGRVHHDLFEDASLTAAAVVGLIWVLKTRSKRVLFPVVLLLTVYVFHCFHRPYWPYHYLHFAVPLAWLAAVALQEFSFRLWRAMPQFFARPSIGLACVYALWTGVTALILSHLPQKATQAVTSVTAVALADDNPLIVELRRHCKSATWVVVDSSIDAFHAKVPVPPPLAVVSQKRVRSGRFTSKDLLAVIIQYKPEFVSLAWNYNDEELKTYLSREYAPCPGSNLGSLLARKDGLGLATQEVTYEPRASKEHPECEHGKPSALSNVGN